MKNYFSDKLKEERSKERNRIVYYSNAEWTKIPNSQDTHDSYERANAICMRLEDEYGKYGNSCSIRGKCLRTWVTNSRGE